MFCKNRIMHALCVAALTRCVNIVEAAPVPERCGTAWQDAPMQQVFISYQHAGRRWAGRVGVGLEAAGCAAGRHDADNGAAFDGVEGARTRCRLNHHGLRRKMA